MDNMGNILYCCRKVSEFVNAKGVEEQSLLLSRENSDIESLSPSRSSADLLASPVLDQDHLLFPDIILSSNLRVRGNSIQPLELLLATRGEAQDVRRDEGVYESNLRNGGERNRELVGPPSTNITGINQLCSAEDEWPLLSSLYQIPAAQNRICTHGLEADTCKSHGMGLFADITVSQNSFSGHVSIPVLAASSLDASQSDIDVSQREDGWTQTEQFIEREEPKEQLRVNVIHTEKKQVKKLLNEPNSAAQTPLDAMKMQPAYGITSECPLHQKTQREAQTLELLAQPDDFEDSQRPDPEQNAQKYETLEMEIIKREHANENATTTAELLLCMEKKISHVELPDITDMSSGLMAHELGEIEQSLSQMDQDLMWKKKEVEQMQWDLEALKQSTELSLRDSEQTTLAVTQVEQRKDQTERFTLFVVDKLFLATPNISAPSPDAMSSGHVLDTPADNLTEQVEGDSKRQELPAVPDMDPSEDTGFTVKIQAPGIEPTDFQVSPLAMVQEIKQVLMDREETCRRTCFSLQLNGVTLDNFTHLRSIPGLQEGSILRVVEEPYTVREVHIHLRHIRELLKSLDLTDGYNGVEGSSPSFLSCVTEECLEENSKPKQRGDGLKQMSCSPPDHILPGSKEHLLVPLLPHTNFGKSSESLKVLTMSSWNPPPGNRKMHGDLLYLNVVTTEDRHFSITASTRGFYVNQSTTYSFNPKPATPSVLSHALLDLLGHISPVFKKNFSALLKRRGSTHPFERIATPFQLFSWTAPALDHTMDCLRAEDVSSFSLGYEEHVPALARDWNEELQTTRELPRKTVTDRLMRDRAVFKANSDFVSTATRGAMAVVDGNVMPINPSEEPRQQMFIWSNIFFSLGFDVRDKYRDLGGEAAAHAAPVLDLNGVRAYWAVDQEGLFLIGTVVIDYRGYRVTAQTIVPGILERDQEQSVVYGSIDFGKTVVSDDRYLELLGKPSKKLRVQRHLVLNKDDTAVELCSSVEHKGIVGNDGRHYILDLLFTFPPDLNFLPVEGEDLNPVRQQLGFPKLHPHRLVCLRQELIDAFVEQRYQTFMEIVSKSTEHDKAVGTSAIKSDPITTPQLPSTTVTLQDQDAEHHSLKNVPVNNIQQGSSIKHVFSSLGDTFDIHFNPNVFCAGVRFPKESTEDIQKQKQQLKDAAVFLISNQIPAFTKSCLDHTSMPTDGVTLTEALHQHGINIRYLGTVLEYIEKIPQKERLDHVYRIALCELITRCAKHLFKTYLLAVEPSALSASVSHFLNCFLSAFADAGVIQQNDKFASRRRSRRRRSRASVGGTVTAWSILTPTDLWRAIKAEAQEYYHYSLPCGSVEEAVDKCRLQRITLLREIAIKTGIQILLREYHFDSEHKTVFTEEDILNIFPVVKHISPRSSDALYLLHCGQSRVQQGCLQEGCELISQALGLFTNVYGALHQDVCICLRLLGRIHYILGDYAEALSHQQRAVLISERVLGIEHPNTIQEYKHLGLYCFAGGQSVTALRLLYRARYLMLLVCGEDHPEMALLDSKIGLVLHSMMACDLSLKFLENALALTSKYQGPSSLKLAQSHHLLAKVHESKGDFRAALTHEKERYGIYRKQVGEAHEKTQESSEYLKHLTHQAVILQKTMNWIYKTGSDTNIPPFNLNSPSRVWIMEQLNLVTGIVLIPLSNRDLEKLRTDAQKTSRLTRNNVQPVEDLQGLFEEHNTSQAITQQD
ncbi:clustered mitochondria protein homolog isoform X1 [Sinocyclocheilus anshuiensis]|uniref:clustered mitochondria protein homolog isoform X1 n=1 Tax=Sinocyclocheilus anshuiensis TaxID=1608454 RepID=UPI0007B959DB|nr:PREDICTED: clustered mitochondria protein homolog isoform X1 [Sinocyclocheilus anshuiensis]